MITRGRQIQAVADIVGGYDPEIQPDQMDPFFQSLALDLIDIEQHRRYAELVSLKLNSDDKQTTAIINDILDTHPGHRPSYQNLHQLGKQLAPIRWLWENWLPLGMMTLLAAQPGVGKTYFGLDLCYRIVNKLNAPDNQTFNTDRQTVVYVDAEDFLPAIHQRAKAWGMAQKQFYPLQRPSRSLLDLADGHYQDMLVDMVSYLDPALIVVDSLSSISTRSENSVEDLRSVLFFLVELAHDTDCALVLVHHVRKPARKTENKPITMNDLRGSNHIIAMARSVIGMDMITEDQNGPRSVRILKTNLGPKPNPLSVKFESTNHSNVARLVYVQGDASKAQTKVDQCASWLLETLNDGPMAYTELKDRLDQELGFNERLLSRARDRLNGLVADTTGPKMPDNKWARKGD